MAWAGEVKRHAEAAHKAWRTKRRNAKKRSEAAKRAAATRIKNMRAAASV